MTGSTRAGSSSRLFGRHPLRGRPVAVAPSPNRLLFAGSEDPDGLFHLGRLARRMAERTRAFLFLRPVRMGEDGESWEDWIPPRGHAAWEVLRWAQAVHDRTDYEQQARLARQAAAGKGEVLPMPPLVLLLAGVGAEVLTLTVWEAGGPCALPKADAILFRREGEILGYTGWDEVVAALPGALEPMPGYPTRYLAADFPEDWQVATLELRPWDLPPPP